MTSTRAKKSKNLTRIATAFALVAFAVSMSATAAGAGAEVERIEGPFVTVVPVAFADNPEGVELMYAECDFVQRLVKPDGSARETQKCHLTGPFDVVPGEAPTKAFRIRSGECLWVSDFVLQTANEDVWAETVKLTVTPSGRVTVITTYPAEPLDCD